MADNLLFHGDNLDVLRRRTYKRAPNVRKRDAEALSLGLEPNEEAEEGLGKRKGKKRR